MNEINDDDLRVRFAALRKQDRQIEPDFATLQSGAQARGTAARHFSRPVPWMIAAACIVIAAFVGSG